MFDLVTLWRYDNDAPIAGNGACYAAVVTANHALLY
jgi:hypothetical protein